MVPLAIGTQTNGVGHPAGGVLRRLRLQADARTDLAPRHPQALALARLRGPVRALARRHRAGRRAAHRLRRARSRHAAARAHPVRADAGRRAAAAAARRVREDADLGARRRGHARGLRRTGRRRSARQCEEYRAARHRSPRPGTGTARSWKPRWRPISTSSARRAATSCRESLRNQLARGREITALDYQRRWPSVPRLIDGFDELFANFDAILTPAARGTAPPLDTTGDPAFCTLWTLCGMPALSLPLMHGPDGLPLGVQLVGTPPRRCAAAAHGALAAGAGAGRMKPISGESTMGLKIFAGIVAVVLLHRLPGAAGAQAEGSVARRGHPDRA